MEQTDINRLICGVRQVNSMLQIIESEKNNPSITLGELQQSFHSQFGVHPATKEFAFYNQDQFLTSLLAYLCIPSQTFYNDLPEVSIHSLPSGWGTEKLSYSDNLKSDNLQQLIRRLRNAIAHGHVT